MLSDWFQLCTKLISYTVSALSFTHVYKTHAAFTCKTVATDKHKTEKAQNTTSTMRNIAFFQLGWVIVRISKIKLLTQIISKIYKKSKKWINFSWTFLIKKPIQHCCLLLILLNDSVLMHTQVVIP